MCWKGIKLKFSSQDPVPLIPSYGNYPWNKSGQHAACWTKAQDSYKKGKEPCTCPVRAALLLLRHGHHTPGADRQSLKVRGRMLSPSVMLEQMFLPRVDNNLCSLHVVLVIQENPGVFLLCQVVCGQICVLTLSRRQKTHLSIVNYWRQKRNCSLTWALFYVQFLMLFQNENKREGRKASSSCNTHQLLPCSVAGLVGSMQSWTQGTPGAADPW